MISASSGWLVPTNNRPISPRTNLARDNVPTGKDFDPATVQHIFPLLIPNDLNGGEIGWAFMKREAWSGR
jgi:hypothetical protein